LHQPNKYKQLREARADTTFDGTHAHTHTHAQHNCIYEYIE